MFPGGRRKTRHRQTPGRRCQIRHDVNPGTRRKTDSGRKAGRSPASELPSGGLGAGGSAGKHLARLRPGRTAGCGGEWGRCPWTQIPGSEAPPPHPARHPGRALPGRRWARGPREACGAIARVVSLWVSAKGGWSVLKASVVGARLSGAGVKGWRCPRGGQTHSSGRRPCRLGVAASLAWGYGATEPQPPYRLPRGPSPLHLRPVCRWWFFPRGNCSTHRAVDAVWSGQGGAGSHGLDPEPPP